MSSSGSTAATLLGAAGHVGGSATTWTGIPERLRARGLRWTPQRRVLVEVLSHTDGHVTGAELVDRCRELDPATTPSTVYRTLDVLEEIGVLSHSHAADGREEFHVLPAEEHGHLYCRRCGGKWELGTSDPAVIAAVDGFAANRGFEIELSHLSLIGRCATCRAADADGRTPPDRTVAILPIVQLGDPILRVPTILVTRFDRTLGHLLDDMTETMRDAPGVGLAANQIGRSERVAVIEIDGRHIELVNPVVVRVDGEQTDLEGCLSVHGFYAETTRADHAVVTALDRRKATASAWPDATSSLVRCSTRSTTSTDSYVDGSRRSTCCGASATTASSRATTRRVERRPGRDLTVDADAPNADAYSASGTPTTLNPPST